MSCSTTSKGHEPLAELQRKRKERHGLSLTIDKQPPLRVPVIIAQHTARPFSSDAAGSECIGGSGCGGSLSADLPRVHDQDVVRVHVPGPGVEPCSENGAEHSQRTR